MEKWLSLVSQHRRIALSLAAVVVLLALSGGVAAATGALTDSTSPTSTPVAGSSPSPSGTQLPGFPAAGGANNIVNVVNHNDSFFKSDGRTSLAKIPGPNVGPKNEAFAYSSCTNCNTLAVALQIAVRDANAPNVQPQNAAVAVNFQCTGCQTGAIAIQDVIPVADPTNIPNNIRQQALQIDAEFRDLRATLARGNYSLGQAIGYVDTVIIPQFQSLAGQLDVKRDVENAPTTPGASPMASPSATVSGSPTESSSATPQPSSTTSP
jgi:putative peptide zinc metalloprotease protein